MQLIPNFYILLSDRARYFSMLLLSQFELTLSQTQPHRTRGHSGIRGATEDRRRDAIGGRVRHVCADCNKSIAQLQGLRRHLRDNHIPQQRCPFCDFKWSRPERIRTHLMVNHTEQCTTEMQEKITSLRGRRDTEELLVAYFFDSNVEATLPSLNA
jgi:hypothetical protein